jgi:hypothetical protein
MSETSSKYLVSGICLALALSTFVVYWQVLNHDFIDFDDGLYVTENKNIQAGLTFKAIKWAFTTNQAYNWHPLTWLSHILDCQLFGLRPTGHHFTNVLFHIVNTLLLFLVFRQMTANLWRSAFIAALFALHPLHVESVAWVSERKDVLSTFFWLLTMWFYIRYARWPQFVTYLPVMLTLALGLMAKQMLVTLPLVLLLLDYWPLQRFKFPPQKRRKGVFKPASFSSCFVEKLPLLALSVIASIIVFLVQSKVALVRSTLQIPVGYRIANALIAYGKYILKMFWPATLGILYPHPLTDISLWLTFAAGLLLLCISIVVVRFYRTCPWLIVGWLWYLGTLVPVIGLVQVGLQAMADRYTYIPLIGLFLIITWTIADLLPQIKYKNTILTAGALSVLSALSVLTYLQLSYWKDSIALFEHTVAVTKNNDILHYNLGLLFVQKGRTDDAIEHWSQAVKIKPDQPTIHKNLAILLARQGKIDQAIEHYRQVLKYRADDKAAYKDLQTLISIRGKSDTEEKTNR